MFITLEGPEGSGKSSQVPKLVEFLTGRGYSVFATREPGGTAIGDQVRQVLMRMENTAMNPRTETLLFCAARAQFVEEIVRPHLAAGDIVISDRYADSTLAYQGYGHGNSLDALHALLDFATSGVKPDLTLLLDVDPEIGLARRKTGGGEWNRLDAYAVAFHKRVRAGYLELAAADPHRWRVIDASQPADMVQSSIRKVILEKLPESTGR